MVAVVGLKWILREICWLLPLQQPVRNGRLHKNIVCGLVVAVDTVSSERECISVTLGSWRPQYRIILDGSKYAPRGAAGMVGGSLGRLDIDLGLQEFEFVLKPAKVWSLKPVLASQDSINALCRGMWQACAGSQRTYVSQDVIGIEVVG